MSYSVIDGLVRITLAKCGPLLKACEVHCDSEMKYYHAYRKLGCLMHFLSLFVLFAECCCRHFDVSAIFSVVKVVLES